MPDAPDWTELEGYGHRIRYRWLDERRVEIEKYVETLGEWSQIRAYNFLDAFRLGWEAAAEIVGPNSYEAGYDHGYEELQGALDAAAEEAKEWREAYEEVNAAAQREMW